MFSTAFIGPNVCSRPLKGNKKLRMRTLHIYYQVCPLGGVVISFTSRSNKTKEFLKSTFISVFIKFKIQNIFHYYIVE